MVTQPKRRPRASPELMGALREGKATLRRQREKLELREKIRIVIELQSTGRMGAPLDDNAVSRRLFRKISTCVMPARIQESSG